MKIKKSELIVVLMSFFLFHAMFINIDSTYFSQYLRIRELSVLVVALMLFPFFKLFLKGQFWRINIFVALMAMVMILASYVNRDVSGSYIIKTIVYAMGILETFLFVELLNHKNLFTFGIRTLYKLTLIYCILTDILMLVAPHTLSTTWGSQYYTYLIGNKFDVVYLHVICYILFYCLHEYKIKKIINVQWALHLLWGFVISGIVECSTGIVTFALFTILYFWRNGFKKIAFKPIWAIAVTAIMDSLLIVNSSIVKIPFIKFIIESVLHESVDLTGRFRIFGQVAGIFQSNLLLGYGYDNNYTISMMYTNAADTQNGIYDLFVNSGILGIVIFFILLYLVIKARKRSSLVFISYLYILIILSCEEITFRYHFFLMLALIAFGQNMKGIENNYEFQVEKHHEK